MNQLIWFVGQIKFKKLILYVDGGLYIYEFEVFYFFENVIIPKNVY